MIKKSSKGLSILEFAAILPVLALFAVTAIGLSEQIRISRFVKDMLQKYSYDQMLAPMQMITDDGTLKLQVDKDKLNTYLIESANSLEKELNNYIRKALDDKANYKIEIAYLKISIDPKTGAHDQSFSSESFQHVIREFNFKMSEQLKLDKEMRAVALQSDSESGLSIYAIPASLSINEALHDNYLNHAVLIGIKISVDTRSGLFADMTQHLFENNLIEDYKVVNARSEVVYAK